MDIKKKDADYSEVSYLSKRLYIFTDVQIPFAAYTFFFLFENCGAERLYFCFLIHC